jgi:hypothetical protein
VQQPVQAVTIKPMHPRLKICLLVAAHLIGGVVLGASSAAMDWPHPLVVGRLGLIFADCGLLGTWGALGTSKLKVRLGGMALATAFLCGLAYFDPDSAPEYTVALLGIIGIPVAGTMLVITAIKWWFRLLVARARPGQVQVEGLHFTLGHLFGLTGAAAVALTVGRLIRGYSGELWIEMIIVFGILGFGVIVIQLAILWATLCAGRPPLRLVFVLSLALSVGVIPPFYIADMIEDWAYVAWPGMFGFQAAVAAGSLLVVRSNGWRLVKRAAERNPMAEGAIAHFDAPIR